MWGEGFQAEVRRRHVSRIRVEACPPDGHVRVTAPPHRSDEEIQAFLDARAAWIRRAREPFAGAEQEPERELVGGETHHLWGRPHRLTMVPSTPAKCGIAAAFDRLVFPYSPFWSGEARKDFFAARLREILLAETQPHVVRWSERLDMPQPRIRVAIVHADWLNQRSRGSFEVVSAAQPLSSATPPAPTAARRCGRVRPSSSSGSGRGS